MSLSLTLQNLTRRGFAARAFDTAAEAADYVASTIHGKTVGIGGSLTVEALGLYERLTRDNTVYWHWRTNDAETRRQAALAQVYLSSANAIAETGEIINIDGAGNRVAATLYGHERVILIAGVNKIAPDAESAFWRARNIAAPLNAKRLNCQTPCALSKEMKCYDCSSPDRICCGVVTMLRPLYGNGSTEVVLVNEALGY